MHNVRTKTNATILILETLSAHGNMQTYEIRITNTSNDNDLSTTEYITEENDTTADYVMERIEKSINYTHDLEFMNGDTFITISKASDDEGYYYTRYAGRADYENDNDMDGGQCTGTLSQAIEMAIN